MLTLFGHMILPFGKASFSGAVTSIRLATSSTMKTFLFLLLLLTIAVGASAGGWVRTTKMGRTSTTDRKKTMMYSSSSLKFEHLLVVDDVRCWRGAAVPPTFFPVSHPAFCLPCLACGRRCLMLAWLFHKHFFRLTSRLLPAALSARLVAVSKCLDPDRRDDFKYQCFLQQEYGLDTL